MSALKPDVDSTHDLGTTTKRWRNLFVDGITVTDDITVAGNLTVEGTTFSIETTNLQIEDPLIKLNRGDTANPANDQGFVFSRGNGTAVDKANRVLLWDESEDEFAFGVAAEEAGTTVGNVAITGYSDVSLGKLVFNSVAGDAINVDTDLQLNAVSDIKLIPGGGDVQVTGNVLPASDDAYDLGSSSAAWQDLFLEGDITLTDAGTLATSAGALTITGAGGLDLKEGDASIINISDARAVALANLTTFDLDGSGAITIDGASLSIGGDGDTGAISINSTAAVSLDADAASHLKTSSGDLTLEAEANDSKVVIKGDHETGVAIHLDGNASANSEVEIDAGILDINVTGAATIDGASLAIGSGGATGAVTIDSTAGISLDGASASNFTLSDGDLSLIADGADNKVVIKGDATSADSDVVSIHLDGDEGTRSVVDIDAGILDIDASGSISMDSDGAINIGTADDDANISIGTDGDRALIKLGSESGASSGVPTQEVEINATHVDINALTSGYQISGGGASSLTTTSGALTITSNQASSWSTTNGALTLNGAGGLNLQEGGADVIAIDDNKDVLFSQTDGSAADPDVQFDGFVLFSNGGGVQFNEAATFNDAVTVGADDTGYDVILYGATAGSQLKWNQATDALRLTDSSPLEIGDSQDMKLYHDGTNSYITNSTGDLKIATETADINVAIGNAASTVTIGQHLNVTGNLTVTGTTVTETVEVISTSSGVLFEGPTNDGHEATLKSLVADSDKQYILPNANGHVALFANAPGTTTITATPSELNYLDITNLGQSEASKVLTADASGDVTLVGAANNVVWDKSDNALEFADSAKLLLGAHGDGTGDLELYHDGTNSHIVSRTGTLNVANSVDVPISIGHSDSTTTIGGALTVTGNLTAAKATVENIDLDDKTITMTGSENDTATIVVSDNGALAITTTDTAAAAANMTLTADGTFEAIGTTITLDSGGDINLEPAAGNKILLDGTISIDGGVVDGATSITSTAFVGTLSTAAQGNITSLGTLTGLGVNGDATFTGDSANMVWDKSDNALEFADSAKLLLGAHGDGTGDLELYHDGTDSHIINRTGTLNVANSVNVPISIGHGSSTTTIGGALSVSGNIDSSSGDLTVATITMAGFAVDADGDTALKSLSVDDNSTIGCDSNTSLMTLSSQKVDVSGDVCVDGTTAVNAGNNEKLLVKHKSSATVDTAIQVVVNDAEEATGLSRFKVDSSGNVTMSGTLTVSNSITSSAGQLQIADSLVALNSGATAGVDIGVYGKDSNNKYLGLIYDTSLTTPRFRLYHQLSTEPTTNIVSFGSGEAANLEVGGLTTTGAITHEVTETTAGAYEVDSDQSDYIINASHQVTLLGAGDAAPSGRELVIVNTSASNINVTTNDTSKLYVGGSETDVSSNYSLAANSVLKIIGVGGHWYAI